MKALVLKDISPEIKKGDMLILKGDFYVKEGSEKGYVDHIHFGNPVKSPNFYDKDSVWYQKDYFKIVE